MARRFTEGFLILAVIIVILYILYLGYQLFGRYLDLFFLAVVFLLLVSKIKPKFGKKHEKDRR